jgi:hypothetical protein
MKSPVFSIAALLAASVTSLAFAQQPSTADPAAAPGQLNQAVPAVPYAPDAIASPIKREGASTDVESAIVQALNADASLKGSKITVAAEKEGVLLTGVATKAQRKKATEIASATAGEGNVVNVILPTEA